MVPCYKFKITALTLILVCLIEFMFSGTIVAATAQESSPLQLSYTDILKGGYINLDRIRKHILFFTQNCSPRITGYSGSYRAAEYIKEKFEEFGLEDVGYQWYNLTIPVDMGGRLEVYSPKNKLLFSFPVYPLWPNSIHPCSTPPEGLNGYIFYAKSGEFKDYVEQNMEGSIVILDFNSRDNWKKAVSLGASAVIFIEPDNTTIIESELKYLKILPMNVPRVYLEKKYANMLLDALNKNGGKLKAKLMSRIEWQLKRVPNILAYKTGTDLKDQWILVFAHYDAWSVVPAMAEGATDAVGIAALLELARFYSNVETKRSIMFIAFSGFGEGIAGARSFVDKLVWEGNFTRALPDKAEPGKGIFLEIGIDLTPETSTLGMFYTSYFYRIYRMGVIGGGAINRELANPFFTDQPNRLSFNSRMTNAWREVYGQTWKVVGPYSFSDIDMYWDSYTPTPFVLDGDAFTAAQVRAGGGKMPGSHHFSYRTAYAYFWRRGTPLDTYSRLEDLENLRPQLEFIFCTTYSLANLNIKELSGEFKPEDILSRERWLLGGYHFGRVTGQVVQYDVKTGYYKPVPNAIIQICATDNTRFYKHIWFEMSDENGIFTTTGLSDLSYVGTYEIAAYVLNQTTGQILYAPDKGKYGSQEYSSTIGIHPSIGQWGTREAPAPIVTFPCGTIEIFDVQDSQPISATQIDLGAMQLTGRTRHIQVLVNDVRTHFETDYYGYATESDMAMAFVQPSIPAELILVYEDKPGLPVGILHNADKENPVEGWGFVVNEGETLRLTNTILHFVRDLYCLNEYRMKICQSKVVFTGVEQYHQDAGAMLDFATEDLYNKRFDKYYAHAVSAWALETRTYSILIDNMKNVINTTMGVFVLLMPFALIAERLFFSCTEGKKRAVATIAIFASLLIVLSIFHPGFTMATNVYVVLLGLGIATLTGPILVLLSGNALEFFKEWREKLIGKHFIGISRVAATLSSLGLGVSYMRKRKLRTTLALVTLILLVSLIIMFTSTVGFRIVRAFKSKGVAQYKGMFIREAFWASLNLDYIEYLKARFTDKALVLPRAWAYPQRPHEGWGGMLFGPRGSTYIRAYYGLTPAEGNLTGWTQYLTSGSHWFSEEDEDVCILTTELAETIEAGVGDVISAEGAKLKVIGILSDDVKNLKDLDQFISAPFDITVGEADIRFMSPSQTLYVPYEWLLKKGGLPHTVVLIFNEEEEIKPAAMLLATEWGVNFYISKDKGEDVEYALYSGSVGFEMTGQTLSLVPLAIVMLSILNLMLGTVTERVKEIGVFSSLGLSPVHVSMIFLAEAITLAVVSSMLGYVIGIVGINIIYGLKILPETFYPNYASAFVYITLVLMMLVVVIPSIYPLFKAAKLVTPSLERKWKLEAKPVGAEWTIPTPFFSASEDDVEGMLEYLKEYLMNYAEPAPGFPFATETCTKKEGKVGGLPAKFIVAKTHIAPFTLGVSQKTQILAIKKEDRWDIVIKMVRETGKRDDWIHVNKRFIDFLRKQLLNWRGLLPSQKEDYFKRAMRGGF